MEPISQGYTVVKRSQFPDKEFLYTPSILRLESGRLVVSLDISDQCGEIYISDDGGISWERKGSGAFHHARLFQDGDTVYLIGHDGSIVIFVSYDNGDSWSDASVGLSVAIKQIGGSAKVKTEAYFGAASITDRTASTKPVICGSLELTR